MKEYISRLNPFQTETGILHGKAKWKQYSYWFAVLLTGFTMGVYWGHMDLSLWGTSADSQASARLIANWLVFFALVLYLAAAGHKIRRLVIRE